MLKLYIMSSWDKTQLFFKDSLSFFFLNKNDLKYQDEYYLPAQYITQCVYYNVLRNIKSRKE